MEPALTTCRTPVLFLVYRRPELTAQVLAAIRQARPSRLLVAADGPNPAHPEDALRCRQVRELIASSIDWPCEVETHYSEHNRGCKNGVVAGINWAFSRHERLIILEDDCLPDASFFRYCDELLERYANDPKVLQVAGSNLSGCVPGDGSSYYASRFGPIWGWATWRRAWQHYDVHMTRWPALRRSGAWKASCRFPHEYDRCRKVYGDVLSGRIDTWDSQWAFARQLQGGFSLVPEVNLVSNIGFGLEATRTQATNDPRAQAPLQPMPFPLRHPASLTINDAADLAYFSRYCTELPFFPKLIRKVGKICTPWLR